MKTKSTSTLAALAALMIIATAPVNKIANVIAIEENTCAIGVNSILGNVAEINGVAPRIENLIPNIITIDEIANVIAIEDINIADIGII